MFEPSPKSSTPNFSHYPLAWLAVSFAIGILLAGRLFLSWQIYLIICLTAAFLTAIFFRRKFAAFFLIAAFSALGALSFQAEAQSVASNRLKILYENSELISGDPIDLTGVLAGQPELAVGGFFLVLKAESVIYKGVERNVSGTVRLFAPVLSEQVSRDYEYLSLNHGDRIRLGCNLKRGNTYLNP